VTDSTLRLFRTLHRDGLPVAVTLQAYLHRTPQDLAMLITTGAMVRLVKGAFAETARHALIRRADIDRAYLDCARRLLSPAAREAGVYPVFGTHDHRMIHRIVAEAKRSGWPQEAFEFEMLYGVRPSLQRSLINEGISLRLYLPYGKDWWPYSVRRVGEHPRNGVLMLRALTDAWRLAGGKNNSTRWRRIGVRLHQCFPRCLPKNDIQGTDRSSCYGN
jgi:proline dehydrogenase